MVSKYQVVLYGTPLCLLRPLRSRRRQLIMGLADIHQPILTAIWDLFGIPFLFGQRLVSMMCVLVLPIICTAHTTPTILRSVRNAKSNVG